MGGLLKTAAFGFLLSGLLLAAPAARAQFNMGETIFTAPVLILRADGSADDGRPAGTAGPRKSGVTAESPVTFSYVPTATQQARAVQAYARSLDRTNPAAAQGIRAGFGPGKTDYNTVYRNIVDGAELVDTDAADATTAFFALALLLVTDPATKPVIAAGAARRLRAQLTKPLSGAVAAPTAVAQLGEEMKLRTVLLYANWLGAQQKQALPAFRQSLVAVFQQQYRLDLRQYRLTARGLTKK